MYSQLLTDISQDSESDRLSCNKILLFTEKQTIRRNIILSGFRTQNARVPLLE